MTDFFPVKNGITHVEDVPLTTIAAKIGTPTYVYSAAHIRAQYNALSDAINAIMPSGKQALICYACKANSNLAILTLLKSLGCGLETVSHGEYLRGLKAGFSPSNMVSTGVGKMDAEILEQIQSGIYNINVESLPELERIQELAVSVDKPVDVIFRLNPDVSGGGNEKISTGRKTDKFGLIEAAVFDAYERAESMSHVNALGLMIHIGSQVSQVEAFDQAFSQLPRIVGELRAKGYTVSRLDIGGGFPVRYKDEDLLDLSAYADWVKKFIVPLDVDIALEPGRYLVANSGVLLTQTTFTKETDGYHFLILDAGMNDLIRPAMYGAYHHISPVQNHNAPERLYDVVGPVCETGDTFTKRRALPEMKRGDLVILHSAGAYGTCMTSNYNTRCRPAEVLVSGNQYDVINARETFDDLIAREHVPAWVGDDLD